MGLDVIASVLFGCVGAVFFKQWALSRSLWSIVLAGIWYGLVAGSQPMFVERLVEGYQGDSFHTLGPLQAGGLILLSGLMVCGVLFFTMKAFDGLQYYLRDPFSGLSILPVAVLAFMLWDFLAPQVYYAYYLLIFDGLPLQWVLHPDRILERLIAFVTPGPKVSLADDTAALMLHALILLGIAKIVGGTTGVRFVPLFVVLVLGRFAILKVAGL